MMDKKNKQYKVARSKERIELRNNWKASRRSLQGCKMLISAEEAEAREKAGKKPIVPKKWKEERNARIREAHERSAKIDFQPKDFHCDELKERRKAKKAHRKALMLKAKEAMLTKAIKHGLKHKDVNSIKHTIVLTAKLDRAIARKQSKEDKAKYKASLVEFKTKYVRTYKVGNTRCPEKGTGRHKKNRGFARNSTAKVYSMKQAKQAA